MRTAEDVRPGHIMPLEEFPPDMLDRIMDQASQPKPPPKWVRIGLAQIVSRGYREWFWQRGRHVPGENPERRSHIPTAIRAAVYERDGYACLHCGATEHLSLDHVHPYSLGGKDTVANLQTLCRSCNSRKGARVECSS